MRTIASFCLGLLAVGVLSMPVLAKEVGPGETVLIQDMELTVPEGFELLQDAKDNGKIILGFKGISADEYLTIYVSDQMGMDMREVFVNGGSQVVNDIRNMPRNTYNWSVLETKKSHPGNNRMYYMTSFLVEHDGYTYYGFTRTESGSRSNSIVNDFLTALR